MPVMFILWQWSKYDYDHYSCVMISLAYQLSKDDWDKLLSKDDYYQLWKDDWNKLLSKDDWNNCYQKIIAKPRLFPDAEQAQWRGVPCGDRFAKKQFE